MQHDKTFKYLLILTNELQAKGFNGNGLFRWDKKVDRYTISVNINSSWVCVSVNPCGSTYKHKIFKYNSGRWINKTLARVDSWINVLK